MLESYDLMIRTDSAGRRRWFICGEPMSTREAIMARLKREIKKFCHGIPIIGAKLVIWTLDQSSGRVKFSAEKVKLPLDK
jgi:hypothetical protein